MLGPRATLSIVVIEQLLAVIQDQQFQTSACCQDVLAEGEEKAERAPRRAEAFVMLLGWRFHALPPDPQFQNPLGVHFRVSKFQSELGDVAEHFLAPIL